MNKLRKNLLIGATVIGLSTAVFAAQGNQAGDDRGSSGRPAMSEHSHHDDGKFDARMKEHMAKRHAELHDKLKLNATQESGWKTFTAAMMPNDMGKRPDRADWEKLSAPERMEKKLEMMKKGEAHMTTRLAAMKTFYATLTPEQQKVFNEAVGKERGHGHRRGPR